MTRYQKFLYNGLLLTAASLLLRGVGVVFGVYLSGRIGAEAMGLYALIASVYSFALTVATSGVGLAVTRLISEAMGEVTASGITLAEGKTNRSRAIGKKCLCYALFFGFVKESVEAADLGGAVDLAPEDKFRGVDGLGTEGGLNHVGGDALPVALDGVKEILHGNGGGAVETFGVVFQKFFHIMSSW